MKFLPYLLIPVLMFSCSTESCKINFNKNADLYFKALEEIRDLNLDMNSKTDFYRPILSFTESNSSITTNVFNEIAFIECHEDGTIIFQAPDCTKESDFRNVVYFVAYSPKGIRHLEKKRNLGELKEVKKNWFMGKHIETLAN